MQETNHNLLTCKDTFRKMPFSCSTLKEAIVNYINITVKQFLFLTRRTQECVPFIMTELPALEHPMGKHTVIYRSGVNAL